MQLCIIDILSADSSYTYVFFCTGWYFVTIAHLDNCHKLHIVSILLQNTTDPFLFVFFLEGRHMKQLLLDYYTSSYITRARTHAFFNVAINISLGF